MLGAASRCDEKGAAGLVHGGGVPDVSRVDDRLTRVQLDDAVFAIEILDQIDSTREQHHEFLARGVAFPRPPGLVLLDDANESAFVAIAVEPVHERFEKLWRPFKVGHRDGRRPQSKVHERPRQIECGLRHGRSLARRVIRRGRRDEQGDEQTQLEAPMSNLPTVHAIYEAFGRGDVPAILNLVADDVEWEIWADNSAVTAGVPWLQARHGKAGVAEFFSVVGQMEIVDFQVLSFMEGGNQVAVEVVIEAKLPSFGGGGYRDEEMHLWTFNDAGKVVRLRHYTDTAKHIAASAV